MTLRMIKMAHLYFLISMTTTFFINVHTYVFVHIFVTYMQHWTKAVLHDVQAVMNTWTLQKGFPLVTVIIKGKNVHLQQEHYSKKPTFSSSAG